MSEEVIELSVEETNKLRASLGLAPLRLGKEDAAAAAAGINRSEDDSPMMENNNDQEVLEMSVDETNQLREKLGLPPLRNSSREVQDANLKQKQEEKELAQEEERERLQEDVQKGIKSTFTEQSLGGNGTNDESNDAKSWAEKLRSQKASEQTTATKKTKKSKKKDKKQNDKYDENDLKGINVAHSMADLEAGSTTVMTLADAPLLATDDNNAHLVRGLNEDADTPQLENVNLSEQAKQSDGLKKKRQLEMGMGRAGGYAGFDDDEFMELGGTGAPSRMARGAISGGGDNQAQRKSARQGFTIGDIGSAQEQKDASDLFASVSGQAVSLEPSQADVQASDFMTEAEQQEEDLRTNSKKAKKKDKFDKKKKKKDKKEKKKQHRRRQPIDGDDESEDDTQVKKPKTSSNKTLLDELEETAEDTTSAPKKTRKRDRSDLDDDEDEEMEEAPAAAVPSSSKLAKKTERTKPDDKRAKYEAIMAKGNERTQKAFSNKQQEKDEDLDDEPDDAFLNAALAKARRLKKLRELSGAKGAEAVAQAVQKSVPDAPASSGTAEGGGGGMTFSVDDTREFTRALRARSEQQVRKQTKAATKKDGPANTISTVRKEQEPKVETVKQEEADAEEDVDMEDLAKEVKEDETTYWEGTTGSTVSVGRGLAGVMNLFKQTGDFTRKNAGKEELRGRAKDQRTYEDYEKLDLDNVVKIDRNFSTDKDKEFASREVKLEYRDKHGRLLTRKEAFRDLCYQFHGHGSSKKKEEKRQKQMEREQAEARMASRQLAGADGGPGMLGALKATQKATGKAFVVHKT